MEVLDGLLRGFAIALSVENLLFALIGCLVGMFVGVLPGIGQGAAMAILIPVSFHLPATGSIIMLAAIFYGVMYGGTISSILVNVPGESESVATTFDGYPMARAGRGGVALAISAIGSFIGGSLTISALTLVALPLAGLALRFGPPEYFALMVFGLSVLIGLLGRSVVKGLVAAALGLLLTQVGIDPIRGAERFTFGIPELLDGLPLVPLIMGFYGLSDILTAVESPLSKLSLPPVGTLFPSREDLKRSTGPILRGTLIGWFLGVIPGMVNAVSTFMSYVLEKSISRHPERFGTGMIEGVAGPETANNSHAQASFIPLLTLGIPASGALAILLGAFLIHGITPGPFLFRDHPDVAWGLIASMYVGNLMLLVLSLPLVRFWVLALRIPYGILFPIVLCVATVGTFSVRNSTFDLFLLVLFTALGFGLKKLDVPLAPAVLAFVLGGRIELALRQSLVISRGDVSIFLTRPISLALLVLAIAIPVAFVLLRFKNRNRSGGPGDQLFAD